MENEEQIAANLLLVSLLLTDVFSASLPQGAVRKIDSRERKQRRRQRQRQRSKPMDLISKNNCSELN